MTSNTTNTQRGRGLNKHFWTVEEDAILVEALQELCHNSFWRAENGFKNGYLNQIERLMLEKLPSSTLKASPHIESRVKTLKSKYNALAELLRDKSGFSWNDEHMTLQCERSAYDEWVKTHKDASGLFGKPFPHYYALGEIFEKDRATGQHAGTANDDEEEIRLDDANSHHGFHVDINGVNIHFDTQNDTFNPFDEEGTSFSQPQPNFIDKNSSEGRKRKACKKDEMTHHIKRMANSVAEVAPKLDGLMEVLSNDREVAHMQDRLTVELKKISGLSNLQLFKVTNILARSHDLLRVFFTMDEKDKEDYVLNLLEHGV